MGRVVIAAGRLRDRITIKTKSVTRDSYGAEVVTWTDLATVWAAVESLSGREYMAGTGSQQVRAERVQRVVIRKRPDVMPHMRVIHDGRTMNIDAILKRDLDHLFLMCSDYNEATV